MALGEDEQLAYVSWFETKRAPTVNGCGLYFVSQTTKCSVINIQDIERCVHLILKFGSEIRVTVKVKRELDETILRQKGALRNGAEHQGEAAMDAMKEFWLNSWIDSHLYKTIYY